MGNVAYRLRVRRPCNRPARLALRCGLSMATSWHRLTLTFFAAGEAVSATASCATSSSRSRCTPSKQHHPRGHPKGHATKRFKHVRSDDNDSKRNAKKAREEEAQAAQGDVRLCSKCKRYTRNMNLPCSPNHGPAVGGSGRLGDRSSPDI